MAARKHVPGPLVVGGRWTSIEAVYAAELGAEALARQTAPKGAPQVECVEQVRLFDAAPFVGPRRPKAEALYRMQKHGG